MSDLQKIPSDIFDKAEKYYLEDGNLSDNEKEIVQRWESAFALLCHSRSKRTAVVKHKNAFRLSFAQAYLDFNNAERLFTPLRKYSKEFVRLVVVESAMNDIKEAEKRARHASDSDWAKIMIIKDKAEKRIIAASGLEKDDQNLPDFSKIQPHTYTVGVPDDVKAIFKKMLGSGVVDVTAFSQNMAKYAEDVSEQS